MQTCLWFQNQAEEAAKLYISLIPRSEIKSVTRWPEGTPKAGEALLVELMLEGHHVSLLQGGPEFKLSEAVSLVKECETQAEIDRLWDALISGGGKPSQCGWLVDRFGVSWQIMPSIMPKLLRDGGKKAAAVMAAFMPMQKLDIATLQGAYDAA
jgi:predicted 3-demethylubiquinone-9 3-methyltransferase (glyoxalase superfamily)